MQNYNKILGFLPMNIVLSLVCLTCFSSIHTANVDQSWEKYVKNQDLKDEQYKKYRKNKENITELSKAIKEDNIDAINNLIENLKSLDIQDHNGDTALHMLTDINIQNPKIQDKNSILQNFLFWGANPNIQNNKGYTPLFYAVIHQNFPAIELLIKYNTDLNIKANDGKTVLNIAIKQPDYSIKTIEYLLKNGANSTISDNEEQDTLTLLQDKNDDELLQLFTLYNYKKSYLKNKIMVPAFILLGTGLFLLNSPIGLTLYNHLTNIFTQSTTNQ